MPHTPGPWAIQAEKHNKDIFVTADGDGWRRLECIVSKDDCCSETAIANAKLIAAAPDLLAALQLISDRADAMIADIKAMGSEASNEGMADIAIIKAAIKKATE